MEVGSNLQDAMVLWIGQGGFDFVAHEPPVLIDHLRMLSASLARRHRCSRTRPHARVPTDRPAGTRTCVTPSPAVPATGLVSSWHTGPSQPSNAASGGWPALTCTYDLFSGPGNCGRHAIAMRCGHRHGEEENDHATAACPGRCAVAHGGRRRQLLVAGSAHAQPVSTGTLSFSGDSGDYISGGKSYSYSTGGGTR